MHCGTRGDWVQGGTLVGFQAVSDSLSCLGTAKKSVGWAVSRLILVMGPNIALGIRILLSSLPQCWGPLQTLGVQDERSESLYTTNMQAALDAGKR
jgi:hypothetical protein